MHQRHIALLLSLAFASLLTACGGSPNNTAGGTNNVAAGDKVASHPLAQCTAASELLNLGAGADATPLVPEFVAPARDPNTALNQGACQNNQAFLLGSGIYDMTGPAGDSISAGYEAPDHILRGIHLRQFARAFALQSPCNGNSVMMVITETGFMTQGTRQTVMDLIAADPELAPIYGEQNLMLSATHTHSGPGGEAHHAAYNLFRTGYDDYVHQIYTDSIYQAIKLAHANLAANPEPGTISLGIGELLDTNSNRSEPAYARNPQQERDDWQDINGNEVRVNKRMLQLRFDRANGKPIGLLNWFGVHTTSVGTHEPLISSDNKGIAAITFERMLGTQYPGLPGADNFVAAFAQADEGDASPNLCFRENPYPSLQIGCGEDTLQSNAGHGAKQLNKAIELFDNSHSKLTGGIYSQLFHAPMDKIAVTDPVVLAGLNHPANLDEPTKQTCTAALGFSMAAGAEDNRGPSQEGISCEDPDAVANASADIQVAIDTIAAGATGAGYPAIPASTGGTLVGCQLSNLPPLPDADYSCHAEKPILFPIGTTDTISNADLPLQIVVLGNIAIVALPWEVTTTSARRLRDTVLNELGSAGIEHAVVASLSNDFVQYLTTREEYSSQQYEGASTHFGPWTLAAVQQEVRKIAISLRDGTAAPTGVTATRTSPSLPNKPAYRAGDRPPAEGFGSVITDTEDSYQAGATAIARFGGGHPRNDTLEKRNSSYIFIERETAEGWEIVAQDRNPEVIYRWHANPESPFAGQGQPSRASEIEAIWNIPANITAGTYRIRHDGTAVPDGFSPNAGETVTYSGNSKAFTIAGPTSDCPEYPALF